MNIYQMQALDYVLKKTDLRPDIDFSYQIVFRMNGELFTGDFLGIFKKSDNYLIHENLKPDSLGLINYYEFVPSYGEDDIILALNSLIYPSVSGMSGRKYSNLINKGVNLSAIYEILYPQVNRLEGRTTLNTVLYNLQSLEKGYNLPFLFVSEDDVFEWVSLNKIDKTI